MFEKKRGRIFLYCVSAVIFFCLFLVTFRDRSDRLEPRKVQVVFFGDSGVRSGQRRYRHSVSGGKTAG